MSQSQPNEPGTPATDEREPTWADRIALQVWIVFVLLSLCFAFLKYLFGF